MPLRRLRRHRARRAEGHREGALRREPARTLDGRKVCGPPPLYRLEKDFARRGFPIARSTMNDLLHRTSELTQPLWQRLRDQIRTRRSSVPTKRDS